MVEGSGHAGELAGGDPSRNPPCLAAPGKPFTNAVCGVQRWPTMETAAWRTGTMELRVLKKRTNAL